MTNDIDKVIENYEELLNSTVFINYKKDFAEKIKSVLSKRYIWREDKLVADIEKIVNEIGSLPPGNQKTKFKISTASVFIHGGKSYVDYDNYGRTETIELGDLIFVISIVYNQMRYYEKFTINQIKKGKQDKKNKNQTWNIKSNNGDKQLYLLSRFPTFKGTSGLLKGRVYSLPNYSGCLGSYGLLSPGDFSFIDACSLDSFINFIVRKKSLNDYELKDLISKIQYFEEVHKFLYIINWKPLDFGYLPLYFFGNFHQALDAYEFSDKYVTFSQA